MLRGVELDIWLSRGVMLIIALLASFTHVIRRHNTSLPDRNN